jgi:FeS assembly SUF system protein
MVKKEDILNALKDVYDPEIPVNIVDLGLIYGIEIEDDRVKVRMTLTARGCPMAAPIANSVKERILKIEGVKDAEVEVVWDPPWTIDMISEEGKKILRSYGFNI